MADDFNAPMELREASKPMKLKIKRLNPRATLPKKAHSNDLGFDLFADATIVVRPGQTVLATTGIACEFPENVGGIIKPRSSQGKRGLDVFGGVIDGGYRGEIGVLLYNSASPYDEEEDIIIYEQGDKIGQLVLVPIIACDAIEVDTLETSSRGAAGFGSTGA